MDYIYMIYMSIALLIIVLIVVVAYQSARHKNIEERETIYLKDKLTRDRQIQDLQARNDELNKLNDRYLSFMSKIPTVIQRLNSTHTFEEITSSVIQLVTEIISTKKVELYIFDMKDNLLKSVFSPDQGQQGQVLYAVGDGLIGMAAQDRMVRTVGMYSQVIDSKRFNSELWMAVPIMFKDRLLGVIGIGKINNPTGTEMNIMKMIADIASVALINFTILDEAKHKANTDPLTGLNNRNYLLYMARHYMEKAIIEGSHISIFMFDIDHFKNYNDSNGHDEGDKLLRELGQLIRGVTRKDFVIVRYGGEEFIVMLPGIEKENAFIYAERFQEKVFNYPFPHREKQPLGFVSISGGVASFPDDGDSINKVIQLADKALYQAKSEGRNRVVMYKSMYLSDSVFEYNEHPADES